MTTLLDSPAAVGAAPSVPFGFQLSDDQIAVRKMVREFAESEIGPHVMEWDEAQAFPREAIARLGELGMLGVIVPEEYGGVRGGQPLFGFAHPTWQSLEDCIEALIPLLSRLALSLQRGDAPPDAPQRDRQGILVADRPRHAKPKSPRALADGRVEAAGQPLDEPTRGRGVERGPQLVVTRPRTRQAQVVRDGAVEQVGPLRHPRDAPMPVVAGPRRQRTAVHAHLARRRLHEPQQEVGTGRLAAAALTDEPHHFPRIERKGHPVYSSNQSPVG